MDPALGSGGIPFLPSWPLGGAWSDGGGKTAATVVAEGIPPIPTKLLEKVRRWEFIDLALLVTESGLKSEDFPASQDGRVILIQSVEQAQKRKKQIADVLTWSRAFAVLMAGLASAPATTMEEMVGLIAHLHLVTQLHKDLGEARCLRYDQDFREWAAAKGVRKWGELNLTIYGRCLSIQVTSAHPRSISPPPTQRPRRAGDKRGRLSRNNPKKGACFRWNFEGSCDRVDCHFTHSCYHCGDGHRASDCFRAPKRSRGDDGS